MSEAIGSRLNQQLAQAGLAPVAALAAAQFDQYLSLLLRWNARVNLTAVRDEDGIIARHFVESIACARALPAGVRSLLDFGSGGGFPGLPIAICRPELVVTLAESQGRKAAFLQEVVRVLGLGAKVHAGRAEMLSERFDCVTLRAVDHMARAVANAAPLVKPGGLLLLMTTKAASAELQAAAGQEFSWTLTPLLPAADERSLAFGVRAL